MMTKQENSEEENCVNARVFQEYMTVARLVNWLIPLAVFLYCYATDGGVTSICKTHLYICIFLTAKVIWRKS